MHHPFRSPTTPPFRSPTVPPFSCLRHCPYTPLRHSQALIGHSPQSLIPRRHCPQNHHCAPVWAAVATVILPHIFPGYFHAPAPIHRGLPSCAPAIVVAKAMMSTPRHGRATFPLLVWPLALLTSWPATFVGQRARRSYMPLESAAVTFANTRQNSRHKVRHWPASSSANAYHFPIGIPDRYSRSGFIR